MRGTSIADDFALCERLSPVVAGLRLDADDAPHAEVLGDRRAAGDEPAAADGDDERVDEAGVLDQLERRRSLAGHDQRVVVRRHDLRRLRSARELGGDRFAVSGVAVVGDDVGAVATRGLDLVLRRVLGHQDRRVRAEQP